MKTIFSYVVVLVILSRPVQAQEPRDPEAWLQEAEKASYCVTNYTALFHKQQRVNGKLQPEETIELKFRQPFSLYLKWITAPYKGSELLYVQGWNENRARVHANGFFCFMTRDYDPRSSRLMENNLRPVTEVGMCILMANVAVNVRKALQAGELCFLDHGREYLGGRETQLLELVFPRDKCRGYDAYRFVINQQTRDKLLIKIQTYDWDDQLFEKYAYENLMLDAGLTDLDFDPANHDYNF